MVWNLDHFKIWMDFFLNLYSTPLHRRVDMCCHSLFHRIR